MLILAEIFVFSRRSQILIPLNALVLFNTIIFSFYMNQSIKIFKKINGFFYTFFTLFLHFFLSFYNFFLHFFLTGYYFNHNHMILKEKMKMSISLQREKENVSNLKQNKKKFKNQKKENLRFQIYSLKKKIDNIVLCENLLSSFYSINTTVADRGFQLLNVKKKKNLFYIFFFLTLFFFWQVNVPESLISMLIGLSFTIIFYSVSRLVLDLTTTWILFFFFELKSIKIKII